MCGGKPSLRWRIWKEANLLSSDSEQVVFRCLIQDLMLSPLYHNMVAGHVGMAFWLCFAGYPEDMAVIRKLPCQSPKERIPVRKMSQDKPLQTLCISEATLEAMWLPQAGMWGAGRGWPHRITFLDIFVIKTGPKRNDNVITKMTTLSLSLERSLGSSTLQLFFPI